MYVYTHVQNDYDFFIYEYGYIQKRYFTSLLSNLNRNVFLACHTCTFKITTISYEHG